MRDKDNVFFERWWKIRWAFHYDKCIKCNTTNFQHESKWLCKSCYSKKIRKNMSPKKKKELYNKTVVWGEKNKDKLLASSRKATKKYAQKNKEVLNIKNRVYRRRAKGLPCMQANLWWKLRFLPFESLEKPTVYTWNEREIHNWKKNMKDFEILKKFYEKT